MFLAALRVHEIANCHCGRNIADTRAELAEAIRTRDIVASGESSEKLNELYPRRYRSVTLTAAPQDSNPAPAH
ncbi:hypothetical protein [Caenimonas soli]|uniref:hypothetical protein n=1 Tax=Caenimonas soli TaxID=2735555 RepID=UPI001F34D457|nr:hypothetical protein [Caenimonas soli]